MYQIVFHQHPWIIRWEIYELFFEKMPKEKNIACICKNIK